MNEKCWYYDVCNLEQRQQEDCSNLCDKYNSMRYAFSQSGIPKAKQKPIKLIPEKIDELAFDKLTEIKKDIRNFVKDGKNLLIYSSHTGNGKTSWAFKMLMHYIEVNWVGCTYKKYPLCMFVSVPTLSIQLKDFNNPLTKEYLDNLVNADLVVWDEMGDVSISDFDRTHLLSLIEQRMLNEKANIYTSNLVPEKLDEYLGARIASRVRSSISIELKGADRRNG